MRSVKPLRFARQSDQDLEVRYAPLGTANPDRSRIIAFTSGAGLGATGLPHHADTQQCGYSDLAFYDGGLNFTGAIPIVASGTYNVPVISYYHSLNFFGRSANIAASLPYGVGTFEAAALGRQISAYRSGLLDLGVRFTVNLMGGPAIASRKVCEVEAEDSSRCQPKSNPSDRAI
jgi:hypothetical protein